MDTSAKSAVVHSAWPLGPDLGTASPECRVERWRCRVGSRYTDTPASGAGRQCFLHKIHLSDTRRMRERHARNLQIDLSGKGRICELRSWRCLNNICTLTIMTIIPSVCDQRTLAITKITRPIRKAPGSCTRGQRRSPAAIGRQATRYVERSSKGPAKVWSRHDACELPFCDKTARVESSSRLLSLPAFSALRRLCIIDFQGLSIKRDERLAPALSSE